MMEKRVESVRLCKKYAAVVSLALLFCALIPLIVFGHSGRTDSQGGHYDRQNGGYHYHHGYSAHDHPGGVCPFEADVQDVEEEDGQKAEKNKTTSQKQVMKSDSFDNADFMHSMGIIVLLLSPFIIGGVIIHLRLRKKSDPIEIRSSQQKEHCRLETFVLLLPGVAIIAAIILVLVLLYFS